MRSSYGFTIYLIGLLVISTIFLAYCEYFHYYRIISQCKWGIFQNSNEHKDTSRVMILADTHLLGKRNGHWFDKLRREWQMYRSFQTTIEIHSPDTVVFLGDLFDEGKWCSDSEFADYVKRFEELFYLPRNVKLIIAAGNHDIGFHYRTNPYLVSRFDEAFRVDSVQVHDIKGIPFITVNSIAMEGDNCFLCKSARFKLDRINRKLRCIKQLDGSCMYSPNIRKLRRPPVLLQHYPMYRKSDVHCNESDEAPADIKTQVFKENWDCLSKESSQLLLNKLEPRLVFSGHTHHGCVTGHDVIIQSIEDKGGNVVKEKIMEHNVASFSWRNKVNPAFLMMTISSQDHLVHKCHLPNEDSIKLMYCIAILLMFLWTVYRYYLSDIRKTKLYNKIR